MGVPPQWIDERSKEVARCQKFIERLRGVKPKEILKNTELLSMLPTVSGAARDLDLKLYTSKIQCHKKEHGPLRRLKGKKGGVCVECDSESKAKWHTERMKSDESYRDRQRELYLERVEDGRQAEYARRWRHENRAVYLAKKGRYRARKKDACPAWLTAEQHEDILKVYERAQRKTEETSIIYHVDHIIPLQGKDVCGLHVPWNLRAIPAHINLTKGAKFETQGVK
jgi:hypothetical protein